MKKIITSVVIVAVLSVGMMSQKIVTAEAAVSDWQKGASVAPSWNGDFNTDSFRQSLQNLKSTGANYVSLVIPVYQANDYSSDVYAGGDTPTDASLISAINYAHSLGLKVMLKPHITSQSGSWRANINANDRNAWFASYGAMLNHLGDIGKQTGAEAICMGTEMISMATYTSNGDNTAKWNAMITSLRTHFPGSLTYSANWGSGDFAEEAPHIGFWGSLDFIGLSAYYPLANGQLNPSVDALKSSWDYWNNNKIKPLADQYGKKILFTEIGYQSKDNAHNTPWDSGMGGGVNLQEQANDYEALFSYWNNYSYIAGIQMWDWNSNPNYGGTNNNDYTVYGKPAEVVVKKWFTQAPPPTNPSNNGGQTSGAWSSSLQTSGTQAGSPVTVTATVSTTGQTSDSIIDVEVYDQSNTKVAQSFSEHQSLSANQGKTYSVTWTPTLQGTYTVRIGVFNNNWTTNYFWNNNAGTVSIGASQPTTPIQPTPPPTPTNPQPTSYDTNIWWPGEGVSVHGVQPFKAMLTNKALSEYTMYWQVDGGGLVPMYDSNQDYPHKEFMVDLTGWNWKGSGPYSINFVSKDGSGAIISQKAVNIIIQ